MEGLTLLSGGIMVWPQTHVSSKGNLADLPPLSCNHLASGHLINWLLGALA